MQTIETCSIDLTTLKKINCTNNSESDIYCDDKFAYKIYRGLSELKLWQKEKKVELLHDGMELPQTPMPIAKLLDEEMFFEGFSMKYLEDTLTLYTLYKIYGDNYMLFKLIMDISKNLQVIHQDPRNIIIGDLHFHNILVDKENNPYFVDIDSCQIDGIPNDTIPAALNIYRYNREIKELATTQNNDRLCLLLCVVSLLFRKHIDYVSMRQYDKLSEHITVLKSIRNLVLKIKDTSTIPEIPYMHEIISESKIREMQNYTKKRI